MSRVMTAVREWLAPDSIQRSFIPPMDGGLRANDLLDEAVVLASGPDLDPDCVVIRRDGTIVVSTGQTICAVTHEGLRVLADVGGPAGTVVEHGGRLIVSVEERGLVSVDEAGVVTDLSQDPSVARCVTDMCVSDSDLLVTVGSSSLGIHEWARGLLVDRSDGLLVRVSSDGRTDTLASGLSWPSGIAVNNEDVYVSLSRDYAIERRKKGAPDRSGTTLLRNLPAYPGRIRVANGMLWVAAPYARNRMTEMFTDDADLVKVLLEEIDPVEWPVPRLRLDNPYRDLMQLGQLRVLGVLKPWAPPRSYGLVFVTDLRGLVRGSVHSRVDGRFHGVTGIAVADGTVVMAVRGSRAVVTMSEGVFG